jgi:molecular chaperone DnaK
MVFDLGGGTLDIAIVSTRNGRLAVLDHQGDNRLGGKDLDRAIAEGFFLKRLGEEYNLPDSKSESKLFERFMRGLIREAEKAKIALSTSEEITVELFDLGKDRDGKPIEGVMTLQRSEVEKKIEPIIERCMNLARRALVGARVDGKDLDRVLLVEGRRRCP